MKPIIVQCKKEDGLAHTKYNGICRFTTEKEYSFTIFLNKDGTRSAQLEYARVDEDDGFRVQHKIYSENVTGNATELDVTHEATSYTNKDDPGETKYLRSIWDEMEGLTERINALLSWSDLPPEAMGVTSYITEL